MASSIIRPSYHQGFARSAGEAKYRALREGLVFSISASFGVTGNTIFDQSGRGNNGTLESSFLTWVVSEKGYVINYQAGADLNRHISVSNFNKTFSNITLIGHFIINSHDSFDGLIFSRSTDVAGLNINASNAISYLWGGEFDFAGVSYSDGIWGTYAVTVNVANNIGTVYVIQNNKLTSSVNTTYTHANNTFDALKIGIDDGSATRSIDGRMSWASIYDRCLTATEIYQLHSIPNAPFVLADIPIGFVAAAGAVMNQLQNANLGADLYNGTFN